MKFTIDYEEIVSRINSVTIEVEDEEEGEAVADELYDMADSWTHPDDIFGALREMGKKVVERCDGVETAEYEVQ